MKIEYEEQMREKIKAGGYNPETRLWETDKKAYGKQRDEREEEFKNDLFVVFDVVDNPKNEMCFNKAWDRGHAYGFGEVMDAFSDLVELIL